MADSDALELREYDALAYEFQRSGGMIGDGAHRVANGLEILQPARTALSTLSGGERRASTWRGLS